MKRTSAHLMLLIAALSAGALRGAEGEAEPAAQPVAPAVYAMLDVEGYVPEALPPVYLFEPKAETLYDLLRRMERARDDDGVRGLIVRVRGSVGGWSKAQEIRQAMLACRRAGKEVICLLESADNVGYYLATGAGRIVLTPSGSLMLWGLRAEAVFARGLLDKIGVKAQFVQAGRYKGAAETLTRKDFSEPFRQTLESALGDYYRQMRDAMAEGRSLPPERAEELIEQGPYTAVRAKEAGLVDDVLFEDELVDELAGRHLGRLVVDSEYGRAAQRYSRAAGINLFQLLLGPKPAARAASPGPSIAVVYAVGAIVIDEDDSMLLGSEMVGARRLVNTIREVAADENVKAVVLRVDSPGGSAAACDLIWRELRLADRAKPVVASFSDTAASGGYYIGAGARRIVAEPGTLTGSIGVMGGKLVLAGLLEKLGLTVDVVERGGGGALLSPFEEFTEDDVARVEELVGETYRIFCSRIVETRPDLAGARMEAVAQGRIWTGRQARENGLVDALGGLQDAILLAREQAGIPADQKLAVVRLPRPQSLPELILFGPEGKTAAPELRAPGLLDLFPGLRSYVASLLALRGEMSLCLMPAAVLIR